MYPGYNPNPYSTGGYPGSTGPVQTTTTVTRTTTAAFNNSWYAPYYHQIQQNASQFNSLQYWFQSVDRDRSGSISANELAMVQFYGRPLGFPCAVKILRAFDQDRSGSIDFREYVALHGFLQTISSAFMMADRDRSGTLDPTEIFTALSGAGFLLTQPTVISICRRYNNTGMGLSFDSFLMAAAHLAIVRSIFQWNDPMRSGRVTLTYDQLANITIETL
eukprot:TRINITY_DN2368_c0_g1_i2.p1 TRINITY_DN2368_c0_g1~~TRINITY_DN2368_c0_g1_i2.p1  ORF type:complete len:234 (+),score=25.15 TRINITY_DN2368_c0_g1_i2:48-704(+)